MRQKRYGAVILIFIFFMTAISPVFGDSTLSDWAVEELQKARTYQLTIERIQTNYQENITREEFCELAVKLYEALAGTEAPAVQVNPFTDTTNPEILKAHQLGIVEGKGSEIFAPYDPVTRQEIAVMLTRTFQAADLSAAPSSTAVAFADQDQIQSWAVNAIQFLNEKNIMGGVGQNRMNPLGNTTREQGIALVVRSYEALSAQSGDETAVQPVNPNQPFEPSHIAEKASDAVVLITTFDKSGYSTGTGSGFIVSSNGTIITNYHVIHDSHEAMVKLTDGREYPIRQVLNYDVKRDVAVVKINVDNLPTVTLGDSSQVLNGQRVLAIGSPLGLENTISEGLISNKNRIFNDFSYFQTTAPISQGSSGGALFNSNAQVIGVTTASFIEGQNLNLAIPINEVKSYLTPKYDLTLVQLREHVRPVPPTGVIAEAISSTRIWLNWDENVEADYFLVYRSDSLNGDYHVLTDDYGYPEWWCWSEPFCLEGYNLDPGTTYYYRVSVVVNGIESELSAPVYATTARSNKLHYSLYQENLNEELPAFTSGNKQYVVEPGYIALYEKGDQASMSLELYYRIDMENYLELVEGIAAGYEKRMMQELAEIGFELRDYYQLPVEIYLVFDDAFDEYPGDFALTHFNTEDVIGYEYYYGWYISNPLIQLSIGKTGESFTKTVLE